MAQAHRRVIRADDAQRGVRDALQSETEIRVVQEAGQTLNRFAEIAELMLYLGILAFVVLALRRLRAEAPAANRAIGTAGRQSIDRGA